MWPLCLRRYLVGDSSRWSAVGTSGGIRVMLGISFGISMLRSRPLMLCNEMVGLRLPSRGFRLALTTSSFQPAKLALHRRAEIYRCLTIRSKSQLNEKGTTVSTSSSSSMPSHVTDADVLPANFDDHGGVIIDMKGTSISSENFLASLKASISCWKKEGKKGVWLKLPIEYANLVQPAVKEGFWYHHAEPSYLMLVYWIPASRHTLPVNATHRVGVGAFMLNNKREVLVVQEKSGKLRGSGLWKLPTGVVEQGEDIFAAASREVKEETGIDAEFLEVLAFRQSHMSFFGKSDLFFVCLMRPLSFDIQKQESEIEAAQWMPIKEFASQPIVRRHELLKHIVEVGIARFEGGYSGFSPVSIKSAFSDRQSSFYVNTKYLNNLSS